MDFKGANVINKTKANSKQLAVIFSCFNNEEILPTFLLSLARQTHPADEILVLEKGSQDRSPVILNQWKNRLPINLYNKKLKTGGETLNFLINKTECSYVALLEANKQPCQNYFQLLTSLLNQNTDLLAAGGRLRLKENLSRFQLAAGKTYINRPGPANFSVKNSNQLQGPICRRKDIVEAGGWKNNLTAGSNVELLSRLKAGDGQSLKEKEATLNFIPEADWRDFFKSRQKSGEKLGELAALNLLPSLQYWRVDRFFTLWSFGLCWNPVGWGMALVYLLLVFLAGGYHGLKKKPTWRIIYLLPLLYLGWWTGWLKKRFNSNG